MGGLGWGRRAHSSVGRRERTGSSSRNAAGLGRQGGRWDTCPPTLVHPLNSAGTPAVGIRPSDSPRPGTLLPHIRHGQARESSRWLGYAGTGPAGSGVSRAHGLMAATTDLETAPMGRIGPTEDPARGLSAAAPPQRTDQWRVTGLDPRRVEPRYPRPTSEAVVSRTEIPQSLSQESQLVRIPARRTGAHSRHVPPPGHSPPRQWRPRKPCRLRWNRAPG